MIDYLTLNTGIVVLMHFSSERGLDMMSLHKFLGCTWCNRKSLLQTAWLCRSNTPLNRVSARVKPQSRSSTNRMVLAYIGAVRKCSKEGKARGYIAAEFHTPWLFLTSLQGLRSGKGVGLGFVPEDMLW